MYREHSEDEELVPDMKNNYFQHSSVNQDVTLSVKIPSDENQDHTLSVKIPSDEKKSTHQTSSEMEAEFSEESSILCPTSSSGHNFIAEPNPLSPSNEQDVSDRISDSSDSFFEKTDASDKLESVNLGLPVPKEKCNGTINKDEEIKKLREEVGFRFLLFFIFYFGFSWTSLVREPC